MTEPPATRPRPERQTAGLASGEAGSAGSGAPGLSRARPVPPLRRRLPDPAHLIVAVGAFTTAEGGRPRQRLPAVHRPRIVDTFVKSIQLAVVTAIAGAIFGGLLAWAVARGNPNGLLRQLVIAASGVLAQFGGVMLAFAFLATFGFNGLVTCSSATSRASGS